MTRTILLTLTLLGCTAWMAAQSTPSSPDTTGSSSASSSQTGSQTSAGQSGMGSQSSSGSETTISGCLSGSAGSYTLTDASGTTYQLQGDTSKLSADVNNQVEVKGTDTGSASSASSPSGSSSASSSSSSGMGGGAAHTFNVTKVKKISSSCSGAAK